MLKKTIRRLGALAMVLAMAVSVFAVNASAVGETEEVVPATNATVSFTKTIDMSKAEGANTPAGTYTFTIVPGTAVAATDTTPEIKAGVAGATINDVVFAYGDEVSKTVNVNFDDVSFPTAGIYRYVITETGSGNDDVAIDTNATRYLDVYVVNDGNSRKIKWSILTSTLKNPTKNTEGKWDYGDEKSEGFTNAYTTHKLSLTKKVTGDMANLSEKFNFTINFKGPAGASFTYNKTTITLDEKGEYSLTNIELNNDTGAAEITGIPSNVFYTITENINASERYTTSYTQTDTNGGTGTATTEKKMGAKDNAVEFTNHKDSVSPTGVIMTIAPYALMVVLAGAFAVVFLTRRNRAE